MERRVDITAVAREDRLAASRSGWLTRPARPSNEPVLPHFAWGRALLRDAARIIAIRLVRSGAQHRLGMDRRACNGDLPQQGKRR